MKQVLLRCQLSVIQFRESAIYRLFVTQLNGFEILRVLQRDSPRLTEEFAEVRLHEVANFDLLLESILPFEDPQVLLWRVCDEHGTVPADDLQGRRTCFFLCIHISNSMPFLKL